MLPTDSQKNKVYALARELGGDVEPETFGIELGSFFVSSQEPITRARVSVEEYGWAPIGTTGYSFARSGDLVRTTVVQVDAVRGTSVVSGLKDLTVLNTTASEFWGYPKDAYTTLPETKDRILATSVHASWRFRPDAVAAGVDWGTAFSLARSTILATFAGTYTYSLQQMLYAIGTARSTPRCRRSARWSAVAFGPNKGTTTWSTWRRSAWTTTGRCTWPATGRTGRSRAPC